MNNFVFIWLYFNYLCPSLDYEFHKRIQHQLSISVPSIQQEFKQYLFKKTKRWLKPIINWTWCCVPSFRKQTILKCKYLGINVPFKCGKHFKEKSNWHKKLSKSNAHSNSHFKLKIKCGYGQTKIKILFPLFGFKPLSLHQGNLY